MICAFKIIIIFIIFTSFRIDKANLTNNFSLDDIIHSNLSCQIPNNSLYTKYEIFNEDKITYIILNPGELLPYLSKMRTVCDKDYKLEPFQVDLSICLKEGWLPLLPRCLRACPKLMSTTSTNVTCEYKGSVLQNCDDPVEGTTANIICNPSYTGNDLNQNSIHSCNKGRWQSPILSQCKPVCGRKRSRGISNIVRGPVTVSGDYPWHVGIYDGNKNFICGGAIIERNIVLSAARCVAEDNGTLRVEDFWVAAGKYYNGYDDARDSEAQFSRVSKILVPSRFKGKSSSYAYDITVLILTNPFTLCLSVQPVCIELNNEVVDVYDGTNGIVTGWGFTEKGQEFSNVLRELSVPYIPKTKCHHESSSAFKRYLMNDKFCAGYVNNSMAICVGDNGEALVIKHSASNRYFIRGVVSLFPTTENVYQCNPNQYGLYTSVKFHMKYLKDIVYKNRLNEAVESPQDKENTELNICPKLTSSVSTNIKCEYNGQPLLNCENPVEGTRALLLCNPFYEDSIIQKNPILECSQGKWNSSTPPHCSPICGNPTMPNEDYHSWHVGIYSTKKEFLCGGSIIINTKIILSAAQCFTDHANKIQSAENFLIAAGKFYREYDDPRDKDAQYSTILEIHIPEKYMGRIHYNAYNIAILILRNPLSMSTAVQPVCLQLNENSKYIDNAVNNNSLGEVRGWGFTRKTGSLSDKLKRIEIVAIPSKKCFSMVPIGFSRHITFDKICGAYTTNNESTFCLRDSGGGLVFRSNVGRYYIKGIASGSSSTVMYPCHLGIYTWLADHTNFLKETLVNYL